MGTIIKMKNFQELEEKRPGLAKELQSMTKEELLDHYALEVAEKDELEEYKENNEFFETELEHIVNLGIKWLKKNKKNKHHIIIKPNKSKLVYSNVETKFI